MSGFQFGTDGSGADTLFVTEGGARPAKDALQPRHRKRWPSPLYMDGPSLISFSVARIPELVKDILAAARIQGSDIDLYLLHQATRKMLERLQEAMEVDESRMPIIMEDYGNTVSATIPILINELRQTGRVRPGCQSMLVGFGVGWSWAGCVWKECWSQ